MMKFLFILSLIVFAVSTLTVAVCQYRRERNMKISIDIFCFSITMMCFSSFTAITTYVGILAGK